MEIKVYVLPGGQLQIFVDGSNVTYDQAAAATVKLLERLQAQGIPIEQVSQIEQHKDAGVSHVHIIQEARHGQ
jgi:hypothetical protein